MVRKFLEMGVSPEQHGNRGMTPLMLTVSLENFSMVKFLLSHGADINYSLPRREDPLVRPLSPLSMAIKGGNLEMIQFLVDSGASPYFQEKDFFRTAFHQAVEGKNPLSVLEILQKFRDPGKEYLLSSGTTPLHLAARGPLEGLKAALLLNLNINSKDEFSKTPAHLVYGQSEEEVQKLKLLLESGADPRIFDAAGNTPLHTSSYNGDLPLVRVLLESGLDVNLPNKFGDTPLKMAIQFDSENWKPLIDYLKQKGGALSVNNQLIEGQNFLIQACKRGNFASASYYLNQGISPEILDRDQNTLLHLAVQAGSIPLVELLLKAGVDPEKTDCFGNDAFMLSLKPKIPFEISQLLLKNKGGLLFRRKKGSLPIHIAIQNRAWDRVKWLLDRGTPLDCVFLEEYRDPSNKEKMGILEFLLRHKETPTDLVNFFMEKGLSLKNENISGQTALELLSGSGNDQVFVLFLEKIKWNHIPRDAQSRILFDLLENRMPNSFQGVLRYFPLDLKGINKEGLSLLHLACKKRNPLAVSHLLLNGLNPDQTDKGGKTPLHYALGIFPNLEIVERLIKSGASPDIGDKEGKTPLHLGTCTLSHSPELFKKLLLNCKKIDIQDSGGDSPLHFACRYSSYNLARELLNGGSNPELKNRTGISPFHLIAEHGGDKICEYFLDKIKNIDDPDPTGKTALHFAAKNNNLLTLGVLAKRGGNLFLKDNGGKIPSDYCTETRVKIFLKEWELKVKKP